MLFCERCKISIRTAHKCCPLCYGGLTGSASEEDAVFPDLPTPKNHQLSFLSMLTFCCVLAFVFSYVVNHIIKTENAWFIYVTGGTFFIWIVLVWGKSKRRNLLKNIIGQIIIIGFGVGICDVLIGWEGWSVNYALPILFSIAMISNVAITFIRKLPPSEYMIYLLLNGLIGLLPFILVQVHIVKVIMPSIISSGLAMILLAGLLIFDWDQVIHELIKKFHI